MFKFIRETKKAKSCNRKCMAFSVAEAMIALLIGSVALGMAAPMITKQIKQNTLTDAQFQMLNREIQSLRAQINNNDFNDIIEELREELLAEIDSQNAFPSGALLLTTGSCPTSGWSDITNTYNNSFIKAGTSGIGTVANPSGNLPEHYHYVGSFTQSGNNDANFVYRTLTTKYAYTERNISGEGSGGGSSSFAKGAKSYSITTGQELIYPSNAVKNSTYQPKNVTVRVCKKN